MIRIHVKKRLGAFDLDAMFEAAEARRPETLITPVARKPRRE